MRIIETPISIGYAIFIEVSSKALLKAIRFRPKNNILKRKLKDRICKKKFNSLLTVRACCFNNRFPITLKTAAKRT